ncbi:hypothetical protein F5Y01DRAFT_313939 [Xylaria sp. FL0043]|nr:hypothetical protein F5Y01DRAFT_313939 [Xylaria sp. FL0043]
MAYKRPDHLASACDSNAMGNTPQHDIVPIAQGNLFGHSPHQPSRNASLPAFSTTVERVNRTYRPVLRDFQHAEEKWAELMSQGNIRDTIIRDIPDINSDGARLVGSLYRAVYDFSEAFEASNSQHCETLDKDDYYTEGLMHIMLWRLLYNIIQAQKGICSLAPWYTTGGPVYKAYPSFVERFRDVELALKKSKACCCSLFSSSDFAARLAWNPTKELRRKRSNHTTNSTKTSLQNLAIQTCIDQGISRNKDGELEDKASRGDGNKVLREKEIPTTPSSGKGDGIRKRRKIPRRVNIPSQVAAQAMAQITEQETAPVDDCPDSSPEEHTTPATSVEHDGDIDHFLSEIFKDETDDTVALTQPTLQSLQCSQLAQQLQLPRSQQACRQLQAPEQPAIIQEMPIPNYAQFQPQGFVDPQYGAFNHIGHADIQQYQFPQWSNNTGVEDNPWGIARTANLGYACNASAQQVQHPGSQGQNQGNPYNGVHGSTTYNCNIWDLNLFQQ